MGNYFSRFLAYVAFETQLSNTFFPPAGVYNPSTDVPDLFGKVDQPYIYCAPPTHFPLLSQVILVTGGYSGIGYETTKQLLLKNAKVYIAGRSEPKGLEAIEKLKQETGKEVFFLQLDLGDLQSVQSAAKEFLSKEERLDVLFANA
jgi:retinol dehydrogenase-12